MKRFKKVSSVVLGVAMATSLYFVSCSKDTEQTNNTEKRTEDLEGLNSFFIENLFKGTLYFNGDEKEINEEFTDYIEEVLSDESLAEISNAKWQFTLLSENKMEVKYDFTEIRSTTAYKEAASCPTGLESYTTCSGLLWMSCMKDNLTKIYKKIKDGETVSVTKNGFASYTICVSKSLKDRLN